MTTEILNGTLARFGAATALAAALALGCAPKESERETPAATDATASVQESPKSASNEATADTDFDAASALSAATDEFSAIFSDSERVESDDSTIEALVDEETKQKYLADRTLVAPTLAAKTDRSDSKPTYRLEYRFQPNSNLAWTVSHMVRKRVSYGGKESLVETTSITKRRWEFLDPTPDGRVTARHWIDHMILRQDDHEKEPVDYDSDRDLVVPPEIAAFGTEKAVGVALENFAINAQGVMSDKKKLVAEYNGREGDSNMMVPFPDEELAVGDVWTTPYALYLKGADDVTRPYRVVERFRLESVDEKYATISFETTLVSIVDDPVVEGALAERLFTGRALFDRELGQTTRTELNFKKTVVGAFGFSSFLEYNCQVVEKIERVGDAADDDTEAETK